LPLVLGLQGLKLIKIAVSLPVFVCIGTLGPFLACFLCHRMQTGNWRAVHLFPQSRLQLAWLILGPLLVLFCFFAVFPALISKGDPRAWHWGAVVVAILMHSAFNASSRFIPAFLRNVPTREHPSPELLIGLSFLLVAAAAMIFTSGRLSAQSERRADM
jgi:hypothetical protein